VRAYAKLAISLLFCIRSFKFRHRVDFVLERYLLVVFDLRVRLVQNSRYLAELLALLQAVVTV
jgi:hypothetical protein